LPHQNNSQNSIPKLIVIFPAKNEERTIETPGTDGVPLDPEDTTLKWW
jgi:hypothetical protein